LIFARLICAKLRYLAKRAGQRFAICELYSATVWEFDITPDKSSATFKHIFRANRIMSIGLRQWAHGF